jgi:hypothetical protein
MVLRYYAPGSLADFGRLKKAKPNSIETLPNHLLHQIARERAPGEKKRYTLLQSAILNNLYIPNHLFVGEAQHRPDSSRMLQLFLLFPVDGCSI